MHNYKDLKVWNKSRELVHQIYALTADFPKTEMYGLTSQIRRSVVSISVNIAEGSGRNTNKDFIHFLHIAYGSALETETLILLSCDLRLIGTDQMNSMVLKINEIEKMLFSFIKNLKIKTEPSSQ